MYIYKAAEGEGEYDEYMVATVAVGDRLSLWDEWGLAPGEVSSNLKNSHIPPYWVLKRLVDAGWHP